MLLSKLSFSTWGLYRKVRTLAQVSESKESCILKKFADKHQIKMKILKHNVTTMTLSLIRT